MAMTATVWATKFFLLFWLIHFSFSAESSLRLVDYETGQLSGKNEGNVQILINKKWWFLCDNNWNVAKTKVACRELKFNKILDYRLVTLVNASWEAMVFHRLYCTGKEESIFNCTGSKMVNKTTCTYASWIKCEGNPATTVLPTSPNSCIAKEFRLGGSSSSNYGRIEIKHDGKWTEVYSAAMLKWSDDIAKEVCFHLGFPGLIKRLFKSERNSLQKNANFDCYFLAKKLSCCPQKDHSQKRTVGQTWVICEPDVRLVGFDQLNRGRLYLYRKNSWNQVCSDSWTHNDSRVLCRQLGYNDIVSPYRSIVPQTNVRIWEGDVVCKGTEQNLRQCRVEIDRERKCRGVLQVECKGKEIRLTQYGVPHGGRIEILHKGLWGVVASEQWMLAGARVVCRELGYHDAQKALKEDELPNNDKMIMWLTDLKCDGSETDLVSCSHNQWEYHETQYISIVGALCKIDVRLVGLKNTNEGKIEIFRDREWQSICYNHWGVHEVNVVCRELGYLNGTVREPIHGSHMKYLKKNIYCNGTEKTLSECLYTEWKKENCANGAVRVTCYGQEGDVRLLDTVSLQRKTKEVHIYHQGILGIVCGDMWTLNNARVVCRELDQPDVEYIPKIDPTINKEREGLIWLSEVNCVGNEKRLIDCPRNDWLKLSAKCTQNTRAMMSCRKAFRLSGGKTTQEGWAERYSKGVWSRVCQWNKTTARTYCQNLGYNDGISVLNKHENKKTTISACKTGSELFIQCSSRILDGTVRLYNHNDVRYSGLIEIFHSRSSHWYRLHPVGRLGTDNFQLPTRSARILCNHLRFPNVLRQWNFKGKTKTLAAKLSPYRTEKSPFKILPLEIPRFWSKGITCSKAIRLGRDNIKDEKNALHYGRVELFSNGTWHAINDTDWTYRDANVVCHYLGYDTAVDIYNIPGNHSNSTSLILQTNFKCDGKEGTLKECNSAKRFDAKTINKDQSGVGVRCKVDNENICKACLCKNSEVNCTNRKLRLMPWFPLNFTSEQYTKYNLFNNEITIVHKFHLRDFFRLEKLDLSRNKISELQDDLFEYAKDITHLNLSDNLIEVLNVRPLGELKNLLVLDISTNQIQRFDGSVFDNLKNLKKIYMDRFTHCCYAMQKIVNVDCQSNSDEFSSCEELLKHDFLKIHVWIVAALILLGNLGVVTARILLDEKGLQFWPIGSLVLSDTLMSVYLVIIGYNNIEYQGKYFQHDEEWRSSYSCTIAGVISLLSSQVSLFTISVITLERFLSILFPMNESYKKVENKLTKSMVVFVWVLGLVLAITPAVTHSEYFNSKYLKFYGQNTVCLALPLRSTGMNVLGLGYCLALYGGINTFFCVYITVSYIAMYKSLKNSSPEHTSVRRNENSSLAKRMFAIVLINLCSWLPVIICLFLALGGFSAVSTIHAWTAVCVFPINSALNPIMYTFSAPKIRKKIRDFLNRARRKQTVEE